MADDPVVELTAGEQTVFGESIATFFANPGYSRDFPRAARIWDAFWQRKYPQVDLDGVLAIDPVALSYLVEGTGPVRVDDVVLTPDTLVQQVLNEPYLTLESQEAQDAFFQETARTVFEAVTGDLRSPVAFVSALARAGQEGRFLVAPFDAEEAAALEGSRVEGSLEAPDPRTPRVDVGFNDATGSKMSYYLRWDGDVDAVDCVDGRQQLAGRVNLRQNISPADAAELPVTVTGDGRYGTEPGTQLVNVQLYGPAGGSFGPVLLDGEQVEGLTVADVEGRPVAQLGILLDNRDDVSITWSMTSGEGQTGDPELHDDARRPPGRGRRHEPERLLAAGRSGRPSAQSATRAVAEYPRTSTGPASSGTKALAPRTRSSVPRPRLERRTPSSRARTTVGPSGRSPGRSPSPTVRANRTPGERSGVSRRLRRAPTGVPGSA